MDGSISSQPLTQPIFHARLAVLKIRKGLIKRTKSPFQNRSIPANIVIRLLLPCSSLVQGSGHSLLRRKKQNKNRSLMLAWGTRKIKVMWLQDDTGDSRAAKVDFWQKQT